MAIIIKASHATLNHPSAHPEQQNIEKLWLKPCLKAAAELPLIIQEFILRPAFCICDAIKGQKAFVMR